MCEEFQKGKVRIRSLNREKCFKENLEIHVKNKKKNLK